MSGEPAARLSVDQALEHVASTCLSPGPPGTVGVELEWLVHDVRDTHWPVDPGRVAAARPADGSVSGRLSCEPGGQVELSSPPAGSLATAIATVEADLWRLRAGMGGAGLRLSGYGCDPHRAPVRVVNTPRYAAMEEFFGRHGPYGRIMMCGTASVQVCLDAGFLDDGSRGLARRWRAAHATGPALVAAFANSPWYAGAPTGWKSTRQAVWARLDPTRTLPPRGADPAGSWARYALDARVMFVRGPDVWTVPAEMTFRDWLGGAGPRPATIDDLDYHLTTLFPPVRPRGWLEMRMIDAQPGDAGWVVPTAVTTALIDDVAAGDAALSVCERWDPFRPAVWARAARMGLSDPVIGGAAIAIFSAALAGLRRLAAPPAVVTAVERFADKYVDCGRCPADDWSAAGDPPAHGSDHTVLEAEA